MGADAPVVIVGTGRCGSTVFHEIATRHPDVCYLTRAADRNPGRPEANRRALRLVDLPFVGPLAWRRFRPSEAWAWWAHHATGFNRPFRDPVAADVLPRTAERIRAAFAALPVGRRRRPLVKLTGWPRTGYLAQVFDDARFVHVVRDGRAVVNSFLNVGFWEGWRGPWQWRWGPLEGEDRDAWERHDRSFVALAALQWVILMRAFERARDALPAGRYVEVRYEAFAADPVSELERVLERCDLPRSERLVAAVRGARIASANFKWRENLSAAQQAVVADCLGPTLERWGYDPD